MSRSGILCVLISTCWLSAMAGAQTSPSSSPAPSGSPATITQSVSQLSAQNAAAERSKIYRAGVSYSHWLDDVAKDSGSAFLQRTIFDRVTWMRLLSSAAAIGLLSILAGWLLWVVRRKAGEIQSRSQ